MQNAERSMINGRMIQHAIDRRRLLRMERQMASTPEPEPVRPAADPPPAPKHAAQGLRAEPQFLLRQESGAHGQLD